MNRYREEMFAKDCVNIIPCFTRSMEISTKKRGRDFSDNFSVQSARRRLIGSRKFNVRGRKRYNRQAFQIYACERVNFCSTRRVFRLPTAAWKFGQRSVIVNSACPFIDETSRPSS